MHLPNLSKRERLILIICVCVIGVSIIYNLILEPLVKKWTGLNRELENARLKLRKSTEILKRRLEIIEQYKNVSSFIRQERGSDEEEIALLLNEIEKLASSSGAHITSIKPRPAIETGYYKRYIVEVESEGSISIFTKFIYEIQTSSQLLNIEKLSISMKRHAGDLLDAHMVISKFLP